MSTINNSNHTDALDQLLINTFSEYTVGASNTGSWQKIKQRIFKHNFLKLNPFRFNLYYAIVIAGVIFSLGAKIFISDLQNKNSVPQEHTNKNIEIIGLPKEENHKEKPLEMEQRDSPALMDQNQSMHTTNVIEAKEEEDAVLSIETSVDEEGNKLEKESSLNEDNKTLDKKSISEETIKPVNVITKPEKNDANITNDELSSPQSQDQPTPYTQNDSLNIEEKKDTIKSPLFFKQEPVIQIDTVVKVINKRKKRKK